MTRVTQITRLVGLALGCAALSLAGSAFASEAPSADRAEPAERTEPRADPAEQTLEAAFRAALANDFEAYLQTIHPDERSNATQRRHIERFSWTRFQRQAEWYLQGSDPASFEVVRRDSDREDRLRVFVKDKKHGPRMPVPVRLQRAEDGRWLITANSL